MSGGRVLRVALGALAALSVLGEGGASPTATIAAHVAIALGLAGLLLPWRSWEASPWRVDRAVAAAAALFGVLALVSAARAPYAYGAALQMLEIGAFFAVAALAARAGPGTLRELGAALALAAPVLAVVAVIQITRLGQDRPAATLHNPNHFGAWCVAVGLFLAAATPALRGWHRVLSVAAIGSAAVGFFASGSRGAALGLAAGLAVLFGMSWPGLRPAVRRTAFAVGLLAVVAAGLVVVRRASEGDPFAWHRVGIWRASAAVALEHPLLGVGPGQFGAAVAKHAFDDHDPPLRFDRTFSTTHSDPLRLGAEFGAAGLIAGLALVWVSLGTIRRRRVLIEDPFALGAAAALTSMAAQGLVDNLSERPALYVFAAVLAGGLVAVPLRTSRVGSRSVGRRAVLVALVLTVGVGEVAPYLGWRQQRASIADPSAALASLDRAASYNALQPYYQSRRAELLVTGGAFSLEDYTTARDAAERAIRLHPEDGSLRWNAARVEARGCTDLFRDTASRERARARYREAQERLPRNALLAVEAGEFCLRVSDPQGALREADRARRLEPQAVAPRVLAAAAHVSTGGPERARHELAAASALASSAAARSWDSLYARRLMTADPQRIERIRRSLETGSGSR